MRRYLLCVIAGMLIVGLVGCKSNSVDDAAQQPAQPEAEAHPSAFDAFANPSRSLVVVDQEAWGIPDPANGDFIVLDGTPIDVGAGDTQTATVFVPDMVRGVPMAHIIPLRYKTDGPTVGSSGMLWESYTVRYQDGALVLERVDGGTNDARVRPHFGTGFSLWAPVTPGATDVVWLKYNQTFAAQVVGKIGSVDGSSAQAATLIAPGSLGAVPILHVLAVQGSTQAVNPEAWSAFAGSIDPSGRFTASDGSQASTGTALPVGYDYATLGDNAGAGWASGLSSGAVERRAATLIGEPARPADYDPSFAAPTEGLIDWYRR